MKQKTVFLCGDCGYESPKWYGKCPSCGAWNTMSEFKEKPVSAARGTNTFQRGESRPTLLKDIDTGDESRSILESVNSTAFSAAALYTARLYWSAVSRASANPRCCCKCARDV